MIPYARMYETEEQARDAANKLAMEGFRSSQIRVLTPGSGGSAEAVQSAIRDGVLPGSYAAAAEKALGQGRSIVGVNAGLGAGQTALDVMEEAGALESDALPSYEIRNPSPLSDFLGIPVLSRVRPNPGLASSDFALTGMLGLLGGGASPLSSMFRIPTLSGAKPPWKSSLGMPLLSNNPAPLSSIFRLPTVTGTRRSWNTSFGFPLLWNNPMPLSSLFGLPALTDRKDD